MSYLLWTVLAGIMGWGASLAMQKNASSHHIIHMSLGVLGALLGGGLMVAPVPGEMIGSGEISILSLMVSFFIALAISMIANLWDRVIAQEDPELDF